MSRSRSQALIFILSLFLSACFDSGTTPSAGSIKRASEKDLSSEATRFILALTEKSTDNLEPLMHHKIEVVLSQPEKSLTLGKNPEEFLKKREQYFPVGGGSWKINGTLFKAPWYAFAIHMQKGDEVYGRFCVLKILKSKVNFMQCYLGAREFNDHFGGKLALQDLNELYLQDREGTKNYNNQELPECAGSGKPPKSQYIKYYPTRTDDVSAGDGNFCRRMNEFFAEADPSALKTKLWIYDPWIMEEIHFSADYKVIERIGVKKVKGKNSSLIHNYIPMEGHLFREYMVNVQVPGDIGSLLPPKLDSPVAKLIARGQYEPLFRLNKKEEIEPLTATSFQWGAGRTRLTIQLNPLTRFSDGSYVEAKDFKRSWYSVFKRNETRKSNAFNRFFRSIKGMDKAFAIDRFDGVKALSSDKLVIYFEKAQKKFPKVLASPVMAAFKDKGSRFIGSGPYVVMKDEEDISVLWPNYFHPMSEELTSLRFISKETKNEKYQKYPIDLSIKTTDEKSTRCSVENPDRRCLRLYFDFPTEKAGWTAEFDTDHLNPDKVAWSQSPEQFYHFASRSRFKINPLKKSKNYE